MTAVFLTPNDEGTLTFGTPAPCQHCGDITPPHEMTTPSGRPYLAHYPSDTCCRTRALEVQRFNHAYAVKYRTWGGQTNIQEADELDARNREITRIMRVRGLL